MNILERLEPAITLIAVISAIIITVIDGIAILIYY